MQQNAVNEQLIMNYRLVKYFLDKYIEKHLQFEIIVS